MSDYELNHDLQVFQSFFSFGNCHFCLTESESYHVYTKHPDQSLTHIGGPWTHRKREKYPGNHKLSEVYTLQAPVQWVYGERPHSE